MIRFLFWLTIWLCTLGMSEIQVEYQDGLKIRFHSWIPKLRRALGEAR